MQNVGSSCEGMPTLQHLCVDFASWDWAWARSIFACLSEFPTINGLKEPRYLPALRSLTINKLNPTYVDWTTLPKNFGTSAHSIKRHRHALESVALFILDPLAGLSMNPASDPDLGYNINEETLMKILWLKCGCEVEHKKRCC